MENIRACIGFGKKNLLTSSEIFKHKGSKFEIVDGNKYENGTVMFMYTLSHLDL